MDLKCLEEVENMDVVDAGPAARMGIQDVVQGVGHGDGRQVGG